MHGTHVPSTLSRRHFILTAATAAGGFMIGIGATPRAAGAATVGIAPGSDENAYSPNDIDAWIAIDPDNSILIRYQRSEMGQGSMMALPMMIAEELHCDWSKVRIEYASPNRNLRENKVYGPMFSHGSMSVRTSQKKVQQVGASARERLIAAAAARWNVPASECSAAQSVVTHKPSGQSLRFGELAADAAKVALAAEPAIKTPAQFTFIPKPLPRVDVVHKIDGSGKFGIDAQVPGMVFAAITACPTSRIASNSGRALSIGFVVGIGVSLWSAMSGVKAIIDALNVIYEQKEGRNVLKLNVVALVFTLAGFAAFLLAIAAIVILPLILSPIGLGSMTETLTRIARWPVLLVVLLIGLAVLYRYGPDRRAARWQWVSLGSVFAAVTWIAASFLFSWYLVSFANYNATYGSLGAVVGLMIWL